jgi:hypothetical protein
VKTKLGQLSSKWSEFQTKSKVLKNFESKQFLVSIGFTDCPKWMHKGLRIFLFLWATNISTNDAAPKAFFP